MGYVIAGIVVEGNKIGGRLGFPTANIPLDNHEGLKNGVYAAIVTTEFGVFPGMASIGTRPTVTDSPHRWAEVNIFGFSKNLYGRRIEIDLIKFVRDQKKFDSIELLREQIEKDKENIMRIVAETEYK